MIWSLTLLRRIFPPSHPTLQILTRTHSMQSGLGQAQCINHPVLHYSMLSMTTARSPCANLANEA